MTDNDRAPNVLLREAAARQAIVDRLLDRSIWSWFVTGLAVLVIANVLLLGAWSLWGGRGSDHSDALVVGALLALVWVSVAVMQVAGRLRALSTILDRSGVLARFLRAEGDPALERRVRE